MRRPWPCLVVFIVALALLGPAPTLGAGPAEDRECAELKGTPATTGCVQEADGTWFFPDGPTDPRIPGGPILSSEETAWVGEIAATIADQIDGLWVNTGFLRPDVERIGATQTDERGRLVPGAGWNPDGQWWNVYQYYMPDAVIYFQSPNNVEIGAYAGWWQQRLLAEMPSSSGSGMLDTVDQRAFDRVPWPWDLADPVNLASFFRWALDNGYIDPVPTVSAGSDPLPTASASDGDCVAVAYWLAPTEERIAAVDEAMRALGPDTDALILSDTVETIRGIAAEQAVSEPPPSTRALNVLLVNAMEDLAAAYDDHADVMEQQLPYEDFVAATEHLNQAMENFREATDLVREEAARCGV